MANVVTTMGETIRRFRRGRNATQEELADTLGVSPQAVSKWETNLCLPDTAMLPGLADALRVSIDALFARDECAAAASIREALNRAALMSDEAPEEAAATLRDAIAHHPRSHELMHALVQVLESLGVRHNHAEIVSVGNRVLDRCDDDRVRVRVIQSLAFAYSSAGDMDQALAAVAKLPEAMCGEDILSSIVEGEDKARLKQTILARNMLRSFVALHVLARHARDCGDHAKAIHYAATYERFVDVFCDSENYGPYTLPLVEMLILRASVHVSRGQAAAALACLSRAGCVATSPEALSGAPVPPSPCFSMLTPAPGDGGASLAFMVEELRGSRWDALREVPEFTAIAGALTEPAST